MCTESITKAELVALYDAEPTLDQVKARFGFSTIAKLRRVDPARYYGSLHRRELLSLLISRCNSAREVTA